MQNRAALCAVWAKYLCLLTVIVLSVRLLNAQEYRGLILGRVTDPSGAVIPNAKITAVGPQQTYTAVSNSSGDFTIPFVQPGTYAVTAEASGFKKTTQTGVSISVAQKVNVSFTMQVGSTTETVEVTAEAVGVNTVDASVASLMDQVKVQNLPLNGRQMYMLLPLLPGSLFTQEQFGEGGYSGTRGWDESNAYVINGVQRGYNMFTLNGAPITQQTGSGAGTWNIAPNIDAVEEFKVMTNTYDASYGRQGGGTINTLLKTGTNSFHGTAFDYWRNSVLDANTYTRNQVGQAKPAHNQHDFGGTIGGPVDIPHVYNGKNRTFFFFSFEGWREILPVGMRVSVPATDLIPKAGQNLDLSAFVARNGLNGIYDPLTTHACTGAPGEGTCRGGYTRDLFPGNIIPANRISAVALKMAALFPAPNLPGDYDNYQVTDPGRYSYNQPIVRIDHNFSDKTRLYGMFAWQRGHEYRNSGGLPAAVAQGNINSIRASVTQVIDVTHTFSPTFFADVRLSYNRMHNIMPDGGVAGGLSDLTAADFGLTMPQPPTTGRKWPPEIVFDNPYANLIGNQDNPTIYEAYDLSPSISKVVGKHNLHFGAQLMNMHNVPGGVGNANGNFEFSGGYTQQDPDRYNNDGDTWASFVLGVPYTGSVEIHYPNYETFHYYAGYIQDDWKIRHNLTLNLGFRWDMETSPVDRQNHLFAGMCYTCPNPINDNATLQANLAAMYPNHTVNGQPMFFPAMGGYQYASSKLTAYKAIYNQWQPRIGFAWGLNQKTVLRGGFGKEYAYSIELGGAGPWRQSTGYQASFDGVTPNLFFAQGNPFPNGLTPVAGSSAGLLAGLGSGQYFDDRNRPIPGVYQYSLGVQRELPAGVVMDISYVGTYTRWLRVSKYIDTLTLDQLNQGIATPSFLRGQVPNPWYGVLPASTGLGASRTIMARKLMVPYPQFDGLYTYTNPIGYSNYNALQVKVEKKLQSGGLLLNGLNFLSSFTWSRAMGATSLLNNNSYYSDPRPYYAVTGTDRPFVFALAGVWGLPVGKGGLVASDAHGVLGGAINGWSLNWIFTAQSGIPVRDPANGNGLPNGWNFNCPATSNSYLPQHQTWNEYLYNENMSCFQSLPLYALTTALPRVSFIRDPEVPQLALGLAKKFAVREGVDLQFKIEAFNALNTPKFGGPDTNPTHPVDCNTGLAQGQPGSCTGYGTISANQMNFPRQAQISLKLLF